MIPGLTIEQAVALLCQPKAYAVTWKKGPLYVYTQDEATKVWRTAGSVARALVDEMEERGLIVVLEQKPKACSYIVTSRARSEQKAVPA